MATIYFIIFLFSITFILLMTVLSDTISSMLDVLWSAFLLKKVTMLNPISLFSALAAFGSSGFILTQFSSLHAIATFLMAIALALLTLICLYYLIVKPRDVSETSLSFSIKQLVGLKGIVSVPIPAHGFGEVIIKVGGGNSNQIAASFDNVDIKQDDPIFVVDEKEGVLYVSILKI